ncbi:MAG: D-alanine--D-alanine ligase [Anaerolineales bacterium]|nr:D-alanine--D-alanine ligase [Anaerolineales bacterium]
MTAKLRIGVMFGGRSGEHEVSLRSARSVIGALNREVFNIVPIGITLDGKWVGLQNPEQVLNALKDQETASLDSLALFAEPGLGNIYKVTREEALEVFSAFDVIFPVLHGTFGEDGTMQGLLELADVPYVGAGVLASSVAMDKGLFKSVMRDTGIPVVKDIVLLSSQIRSDMDGALAEVDRIGGYPVFTKPANLGSSVGVSKCTSRADLVEGLLEAAEYDRRVVVEEGLDAREIEVSVLGNETPEASVPGEIVPCDAFYSYRAKYIDDDSDLLIPAPIDKSTTDRVKELAVKAYKAIDCAGMARVDFLLDRNSGALYLNEINTIPGFTSISMYPKLWEESGLAYPQLMEKLVDLAFERYEQKSALKRKYGA